MLSEEAKMIDVVDLCWFQSSLSPGFATIVSPIMMCDLKLGIAFQGNCIKH